MNYKIIILLVIISFSIGCNYVPSEVNVAYDGPSVYCGQEAKIDTKLFKGSQNYAEGNFVYRAARGKVSGDTYQAPNKPGEDTIIVVHNPSKVEKQVTIKVIRGPRIEIKLDKIMANNSSVIIDPKVFIGEVAQQTKPGDFKYSAVKGKFEGAKYFSPFSEEKEEITITYNNDKLNLQKKVQVEVKAKPILTVTAPGRVVCKRSVTFDAYFNKAGKRIDIPAGELKFTAKLGSFSQNVYRAPNKPGQEQVVVSHDTSKQKKQLDFKIEEDVILQVEGIKKGLVTKEKLKLVPKLIQSGKEKPAELTAFAFAAKKGKFENNIYQAPEVEEGKSAIKDQITISHKTSGLKKTFDVSVEYAEYLTVATDRFRMPVPTSWDIITTDMGFIAKSYQGKIKWDHGSEIKALALSGFDFLEPQTIMVLFQQQGGIGKHMEKVGEDEIQMAGQNVVRVLFESSNGPVRKSWWIIFKRSGVVYLFTISGDEKFFASDIPDQVVKSFDFVTIPRSQEKLKIPKKLKLIEEPFFNIKVPEDWKSGNIHGIFFASSNASTNGEKIGLFVLGYRSREIQSMDLSLILLLFRQETVKDPNMKASPEKEIKLSGITAKMVEFAGGKSSEQKMWLVATKHNFTGYVIIISGPSVIWEANPEFGDQILQTFQPK